MRTIHFPFTHTIDHRSYFLLLANIFLIIILGRSYFSTPIFYLMILLATFKAAIYIKNTLSDYAIKTDAEYIYLNQGLLVNHLKIPIKAINHISAKKKEIHISNLPEFVTNPVLKTLYRLSKTKRIGLSQISTTDIKKLKHQLNR